eukprot:9173805-Alexandrium_andersonii.AAC.1
MEAEQESEQAEMKRLEGEGDPITSELCEGRPPPRPGECGYTNDEVNGYVKQVMKYDQCEGDWYAYFAAEQMSMKAKQNESEGKWTPRLPPHPGEHTLECLDENHEK